MTWDQFAKLWNDYGAFVTLCVAVAIACVVGLSLLVKFWPVLTRIVDVITTFNTLPGKLETLDEKITAGVVGNAGTAEALAEHMADGNRKFEALQQVDNSVREMVVQFGDTVGRFDERLERIEEKAGIAAHQTTNNGGASLKDAADRTERTTTRLETLMRELIGKVDAGTGNTTDHSGVTNNFGMSQPPTTGAAPITP